MNILLDFQEIQFLEIHCGPLRANVADSYDCRPPAVHTNKHTVQTYTQRQLRCVATETPFSQRKKKKREAARAHHYCLSVKRGSETVEWRLDEEVESHIQHMP